MASYGHPQAQDATQRFAQSAAHSIPMAGTVGAPSGTFQAGTKIQVGSHRVVIQKYLSEGGFAHVYLVNLPKPIGGTDVAVLKRVAVPDKEALRGMRIEVETMKRLKGHKPIVTYIDSHASELLGGGYEVFLLMEYCNGGGLIDFMNTRLQHRLTEPEIINIFADIAEGVACMHYLKPPLLHRDLKVENVLITARGTSKRFKLCDFGSACPPKAAPTSVAECRLMDEDVQRHTTMQYRSPEMVDVYRKQPINEKSDVWALGVLLYKLCYYTTPFEDQGQLAILNASFKYPSHPIFSDRLKKFIGSMLRENLNSRPNIYQVVKEACAMQGRPAPIHDIYSGKPQSPSKQPSTGAEAAKDLKPPAAKVGAVISAPVQEKQALPSVVPMRRGRPAASTASAGVTQRPSPSPLRVTEGDPFAALDSRNPAQIATDDFNSRFPSLDKFSLLHDRNGNFDFDSDSRRENPTAISRETTDPQREERLADEVFAASFSQPSGTESSAPPQRTKPVASSPRERPLSSTVAKSAAPDVSRAQSIISGNADLQAIAQPGSRYVSTGTSTADLPSEKVLLAAGQRHPASRAVEHIRSTSLSSNIRKAERPFAAPTSIDGQLVPEISMPARSPIPSSATSATPQSQSSQRNLLGPDFNDELPASASRSARRPRPVSASYENSTLDFLRDKETTTKSTQPSPRLGPQSRQQSPQVTAPSRKEEDNVKPETEKYLTGAPVPSGRTNVQAGRRPDSARNVLSGRFNEAFKRFERNETEVSTHPSQASSPNKSSPTRVPTSSYGQDGQRQPVIDGLDDATSPEMRRELEKLQLEEEEMRVKAGQDEYRRNLAESAPPVMGTAPYPRSIGGVSRATSIQNRVHNLLQEGQQSGPIQRTAEGYGKYSDASTAASKPEPLPTVSQEPSVLPKVRTTVEPIRGDSLPAVGAVRSSTGPAAPKSGGRPPAPKRKPVHLNSLPIAGGPKERAASSRLEQLIAADLPGQPVLDMTEQEKDSYLQDFSKRFPSLGTIEMVGSDAGKGAGA